jgi:hypothetical protein
VPSLISIDQKICGFGGLNSSSNGGDNGILSVRIRKIVSSLLDAHKKTLYWDDLKANYIHTQSFGKMEKQKSCMLKKNTNTQNMHNEMQSEFALASETSLIF